MPNVYEYQSLTEGDYIRVLILNPGTDDEPLSGELRVIQLSKPDQDDPQSAQEAEVQRKTPSESKVIRWIADIPYEAISYVWGSYEKDHTILLSGKTHQITANLSDALHQCRLPDQPRALWADSICIDQEYLKEKNHQVYMMGRIYASSQCTLICLGTGSLDRHHARDASALIWDVNEMIQGVFQRADFSWELDSFPQPLPNDPLVRDSRWQSYRILVSKTWFDRGWIIQEAAFAREARILWEDCDIAFLHLLRVNTWLRSRVQLLSDIPSTTWLPDLLRQIFFHQCRKESMVFSRRYSYFQDLDILATLRYARQLGLSDPRDRIYAFMALPFVTNPMPDLHPNYEQSHLELYQHFAVRYLEETSDLDILGQASHTKVKGNSADNRFKSSWVPLWDYDADYLYYPDHWLKFRHKSERSEQFAILHGRNGAPALLQVQAVVFDSIRSISLRFQRSMSIEDVATVWSQFSKGADPASRQDKSSTASDRLLFLKALSAGRTTALGAVKDHAAALKSYASFLETNEQEIGSQRSPHIPADTQYCHRRLMTCAADSKVFILERGYFGLGSRHIKQGDICVFVLGVSLPLILRKLPDEGDGHYNVIGSAFVVSMALDKEGLPMGLSQLWEWENWDDLCEKEGWADWGLKAEKIVLH